MRDLERPVSLEQSPQPGWASDIAAAMLHAGGLKYVALNPGASYRGFHDSLVNCLGNRDPQMLLCLHEDHAVSIAHGYAKATDEPMACVLHSNVGLMHGLMGIFNAWCDHMPILVSTTRFISRPSPRRATGQSRTAGSGSASTSLRWISRDSLAQGVDGEGPVKTVPELERAIERGLAAVRSGKPYLIDALVPPVEASPQLSRGE